MTKDYEIALQEANTASAEFRKIQTAYRAREIGDTEDLAGRKAFAASQKKFDAAYAKVQKNAAPVDYGFYNYKA